MLNTEATGEIPSPARTGPDPDEADLLRARIYALLGQLLARPPGASFLACLAGLQGQDGTALGDALNALARLAATTSAEEAEREFNALFIGVERGELLPYASYYLTGFLHDRPLARLRRDMAALGIERAPGVAEPEDHIAAMCEMMAGLLEGAFGDRPAIAPDQALFFERHLAPWAGRFFEDLERARGARLYRPVGTIGRLFVAVDAAAQQYQPDEGRER